MSYTPPSIQSLGSVSSMTLDNKIGFSADALTAATGGQIVGDIVPNGSLG